MKLVLLGSGGYFPTTRRQTACIMLPDLGVILDAGSGLFRLPDFLKTDALDIFLSHAHLDHVVGLTYLVNIVPHEVARHTTVHGESAKLAAIQEHLFASLLFPVKPPLRFQPLVQSVPLPQNGILTSFPLSHPGGSIGYRLDWPGHSLAYITDTTAAIDAPYVGFIHGVDVLVHEAYFPENVAGLPDLTGHSWLKAVAEVAGAAHVGRLVLVHIDPQLEEDVAYDLGAAQRVASCRVDMGTDLMELEF